MYSGMAAEDVDGNVTLVDSGTAAEGVDDDVTLCTAVRLCSGMAAEDVLMPAGGGEEMQSMVVQQTCGGEAVEGRGATKRATL